PGFMPTRALAAAGQHTTLASFQQNVRADEHVQSFDGPDAFAYQPPPVAAPSGYAYVVASATSPRGIRTSLGFSAFAHEEPLLFTFSGRPVSALGFTIRIVNFAFDPATAVARSARVQTNTGEVFTVNVPAAGMFFGFTTAEPFTSVTITDVD